MHWMQVPGSLVISGPKGTYRRIGTVNGQGDYGFMVSALDGQISENWRNRSYYY